MTHSAIKTVADVRRDIWLNKISERNASGLSIKTWCNREGIKEAQYYYWLKKIRTDMLDSYQSLPPTFVPLLRNDLHKTSEDQCMRTKASQPELTFKTDNVTITTSVDLSFETMLKVIKALKHA